MRILCAFSRSTARRLLFPATGIFAANVGGAALSPNLSDTTTFFGTARINVDTRQRTDFGVLRTFFEMAGDGQAPTAQGWVNNFVLRHAMIQISNPVGVFTAGLTFSFFSTPFPASGVTTGGAGALGGDFLGNRTARVPLFAYSANLGQRLHGDHFARGS